MVGATAHFEVGGHWALSLDEMFRSVVCVSIDYLIWPHTFSQFRTLACITNSEGGRGGAGKTQKGENITTETCIEVQQQSTRRH